MPGPIFALADEYVTRFHALDPVTASYYGDDAQGGGTDYGPDGTAARADLIRDTLRRLNAIEPADDIDARAGRHLRERLEAQLAEHDAGEWKRDVVAAFGLIQTVRESVELMERDSADGWQRVANRLAAVPGMLAGWRDSLALGLAEGRPAARREGPEAAVAADAYAGGTHTALVGSYGTGPLRAALETAADAAHRAYAQTAEYLRHG